MYFEVTDLIVLIFLILACSYFWSAQRIKEMAFRATKAHCNTMEVQLLDQSVYLRAVWLKRDGEGKIRVWRSFNFEFTSTGEERNKGMIVLLGRKVLNIDLGVFRI